jgi:hypothetical protein
MNVRVGWVMPPTSGKSGYKPPAELVVVAWKERSALILVRQVDTLIFIAPVNLRPGLLQPPLGYEVSYLYLYILHLCIFVAGPDKHCSFRGTLGCAEIHKSIDLSIAVRNSVMTSFYYLLSLWLWRSANRPRRRTDVG